MKNLIVLFLFLMSLNSFSQYATEKYVDSLYTSLDSIVVKPTKVTYSTNTVILDTLIISTNSRATFNILVETDNDVTIKTVYIKNVGGIYSIIDDYDTKPFSRNRKNSIFSSTIYYQITSSIVNRMVVITAVGKNATLMNWTLSRQKL